MKFWERIAQAARDQDDIDITIHFSGRHSGVVRIGANVRYVIEPPGFSTERLPFLPQVPAHTDLAPRHPRVLRRLCNYDVVHTTDAYFAYARSAAVAVRRWGIPYVTSVHTNTPNVARLFTRLTIRRVCGSSWLADFLVQRLNLPRLVARRMERRLADHQQKSAFTFVARQEQLAAAMSATGGRAGLLRRGLGHRFFTPAKRDRAWLRHRFGVEPDAFAILFVGQLSPNKNARVVAQALASRTGGAPFRFICAGEGPERAEIEALLGARAVCPGHLDPETLSRLYASSDVFAFPSEIEEHANVVLEALASGLPVLVSIAGGMGCVVDEGRTGLALPGREPAAWAEALDRMMADRERFAAMSAAARRHAELHVPSWSQVLREDLIPRWQDVVRRRRAETRRDARLGGASPAGAF